MARVHNNIFVRGLTGSVGDQFTIRKTRYGQTIIANKPVFDPDREFTEPQKKQQSSFKRASKYATRAQDLPVYQEKAAGTPLSAYNIAMADCLSKPEVTDIDTVGWSGQAGQTISIYAQDNFMVTNVRLVIRRNGEDHDALDGGEAVQSETNGLLWKFTSTASIVMTAGMQLDAYAYDLAGNLGLSSLVLE